MWQWALLLYLPDTGAACSVATTYTIKGSTCCMKCYLYLNPKNADVCYKRIQVLIDTKIIKLLFAPCNQNISCVNNPINQSLTVF